MRTTLILSNLMCLAGLALVPACSGRDTAGLGEATGTDGETGPGAESGAAETGEPDPDPDPDPDPAACMDAADCDDQNPCTDDSCDGEGSCAHTSATGSCDDGSSDTANDRCVDGRCEGIPYSCTVTQCIASNVPNGADCDTSFDPSGTPCDDGDAATSNDVCDGQGECVGTIDCSPRQCDETAKLVGGVCERTPKPSGVGCDDGDDATRDDACDGAGACGGTPYGCTVSTCEASAVPNGSDCDVTFEPSGTGCDDGLLDTRDDECDGHGGCAGTQYSCPSPVACQLSVTPNGTDCTVTPLQDGANCSDGETCTVNDRCESGVCVSDSLCGNGTCDASCGEHAGTCAADCLTTVGQCDPGENACTHWADCHSTTTGNGLCANIGCGQGQVGDCFCEPTCVQYGDCCQDMLAECGCN